MDAAEIEARALIPAEPKDRQVDGSIAQKDSVGGAFALGLRAAHFHEIKRLLVELCRGVRVFRRDGDVTKLRHCCLLPPALGRGEGNHNISVRRAKSAAAIVTCHRSSMPESDKHHAEAGKSHSGSDAGGIDRKTTMTTWPVGPRLALGPDHGRLEFR